MRIPAVQIFTRIHSGGFGAALSSVHFLGRTKLVNLGLPFPAGSLSVPSVRLLVAGSWVEEPSAAVSPWEKLMGLRNVSKAPVGAGHLNWCL